MLEYEKIEAKYGKTEHKNIKKKVQTKDIMITLIKYNHNDRLLLLNI